MNLNLREWALPVYTVLMQLSVGGIFTLWLIRAAALRRYSHDELDRMTRMPMLVIFFTVLVAMIGSHLHLSHPLSSFLAVLNVRHSWLSREILFSVLFFASMYALVYLEWFVQGRQRLKTAAGWLTIALGLANLYCMGHIYLLPTQAAWDSPLTIVSFYATALLLGPFTLITLLAMDFKVTEAGAAGGPQRHFGLIRESLPRLGAGVAGAAALALLVAGLQIASLRQGDALAQVSLQLLLGFYRPLLLMRVAFLLAGVAWLAFPMVQVIRQVRSPGEILTPVYVSCLLALVGEILGRFMFYATHVRVGL